ncbi:TIGR04561 family membrane protein [Spiroplasma tabanidicola]|uniref:TIGR04561 family membrane protein n=1 Tax=Spiroplasma tabanidicola TaxID=324079 RepID=A0A6I6C7K5_9MOLU|nr:TIGR04561 family membrane protein [Spiroplasma tabanidicola]QGS51776.1 TIGR04561 family membrane protein [Spiroplasma tabanidicola]
MFLAKTFFKVLTFEIPLWVILLIFALIGIASLSIYFFILFRKNKKFVYEKEEVSAKDFKRLDKFETLRNDFEVEIAQVKKIRRNSKK